MQFLKRDCRGTIYDASVASALRSFTNGGLDKSIIRALESGVKVRCRGFVYRRAGDQAAGWCEVCYRQVCVCIKVRIEDVRKDGGA